MKTKPLCGFANLDVQQIVGASNLNVYSVAEYNADASTVSRRGGGFFTAKEMAAPPPPPPPQPEKITVTATVQCAFQIQ
jgi:hypothetical protein